jgi:hypothetical protein
MRRIPRVNGRPDSHTLLIATLMLIVAALPAAAFARVAGSDQQGTSAYVYVGSSPPIPGQIFGYAVAQDGSAQPVPASPFSGPAWSLVGTGNHVFATDDETNIATYTADSSGSLTETSSVDGTRYDPDQQYAFVWSLSLPLDGRNLYTDNWFFDGSNNDYESWTVGTGGVLTYLSGPNPMRLYSTAGGWPLTFTADGRFAYVWSVCKWDGGVWGYRRHAGGMLTPFQSDAQGLAGPDVDSWSLCSQGIATSALGYVAAAWNGSLCCGGPEGIATYRIGNNGVLSKVSQVITNENAMAFDPSGRYLAVALTGGIQMYQLQSNGTLLPIGAVQEPAVPFGSFAWDSSGHLYAITNPSSQFCQQSGSACGLYIFNSNAGGLSLAPGSPYAIPQASSVTVLAP